MNYTITDEDAKRIIISRLYLIIPCALVGITVGLLSEKRSLEFLPIVLPGILVLVAATIFFSLLRAKKKLLAVQFIIEHDALIQMKEGALFRRLGFNDPLTLKENIMGLIIKGPEGFIGIPKQLACYNEMKAELESRINRS